MSAAALRRLVRGDVVTDPDTGGFLRYRVGRLTRRLVVAVVIDGERSEYLHLPRAEARRLRDDLNDYLENTPA